ncbi:hypothetical protein M2271_007258 [Streptomyces sp. LBL]|uniref:DUF397 domain-containing protein n=1 Tax=Streptomyces sp. LBL TaxID=2940562 RepID=UPI002473A05D|nr:DUF397 domain-containing protein [Streptomyces sp. LBL]MDH6629422.1 hypothetical protein [Streptomyces sp. LBL]
MAPNVAEESAWRKSSYSNDTGGSCLEIAALTNQVGIRDSKDKQGPALIVPSASWAAFVTGVQSNESETRHLTG